MKTSIRSLCLAALLLLGSVALSLAQTPVSTGMIAGYQPKEGTLTIRSDQTQALITFFGVDHANIFTADGKPMQISALPLGSRVTVEYAVRDNRWYVSKVILPADAGAAPSPKGLPVNAPPSNSRAAVTARDGDITTNSDVKRGRVEQLKFNR